MKRLFFARSFVFGGNRLLFAFRYGSRKEKRAGCLATACLCVNLKFNTMKKHKTKVKAVFVFTK